MVSHSQTVTCIIGQLPLSCRLQPLLDELLVHLRVAEGLQERPRTLIAPVGNSTAGK